MPSVEEAIRSHRQRVLVLYRLADCRADCAAYQKDDDDEAFWSGMASMMDDVLSFLMRLRALLPPDIQNREVPTDQDFEEGTE